MGVGGVIVDLAMNTRKVHGDVKSGEKGESGCGIELSFLLNLK